MELIDKYISTTEKIKDPKSTKVVISDESSAICEYLELLIKKIEQTRQSMFIK